MDSGWILGGLWVDSGMDSGVGSGFWGGLWSGGRNETQSWDDRETIVGQSWDNRGTIVGQSWGEAIRQNRSIFDDLCVSNCHFLARGSPSENKC